VIFRCSPTIKVLEKKRQARTPICRIHSGRLPITVLSFLLLSFLLSVAAILPASAQEEENAGKPEESVIVETISKPAPVLYESQKLRDPFLHLAPPKTPARKVEDEEVPRGAAPPGIEGTYIDDAGFEGVLIRSGNIHIAVVRSSDNRAYFLHEGDRLFDGYIKTIENDSVVFIRETLMMSGKLLTEEVTKRLRES